MHREVYVDNSYLQQGGIFINDILFRLANLHGSPVAYDALRMNCDVVATYHTLPYKSMVRGKAANQDWPSRGEKPPRGNGFTRLKSSMKTSDFFQKKFTL